MARIVLNEMSYFGAGSRNELKGEITGRGFTKAFVVTDKDLVKFGVSKLVTDVLDSIKFPYVVTDEVKANPTVANVQNGLKAFKASGADVLIAIGGGSVIDTAKAIGIISNNPSFADVISLEGVANTTKKSVPIIAFPTTAGTAAEVTINYVITDEKAGRKLVCVDPKDIPVLTIVDAELMMSMPKGLTAATGMDALTHAIEGYITLGAWEMTDMFELKAIEIIAKNLFNAVSNGKDKTARENMALGQYIAGMGFSNVGLGIVHAMAHPLGAVYDTPHGVANAILLPTIMEFNMESEKLPKYRAIAKAMGVEGTCKMTDKEAGIAAVNAVKALSIAVGIPQDLKAIVKEKDLDKIAGDAVKDPCAGGNPRSATKEQIIALYRKLL